MLSQQSTANTAVTTTQYITLATHLNTIEERYPGLQITLESAGSSPAALSDWPSLCIYVVETEQGCYSLRSTNPESAPSFVATLRSKIATWTQQDPEIKNIRFSKGELADYNGLKLEGSSTSKQKATQLIENIKSKYLALRLYRNAVIILAESAQHAWTVYTRMGEGEMKGDEQSAEGSALRICVMDKGLRDTQSVKEEMSPVSDVDGERETDSDVDGVYESNPDFDLDGEYETDDEYVPTSIGLVSQ